MKNVLVVSNHSDDPFAIDVSSLLGQLADISDIISLKSFANTEFCPRFLTEDSGDVEVGHRMDGKTVVIVSTSSMIYSRNEMAMRTALVARAAKDNGAKRVILVEPDLFYSAQDRGPRSEHGEVGHPRSLQDRQKFDGQPWSTQLYAGLLKLAGVDTVITVHNHSMAVQSLFSCVFEGRFHNLKPARLYAHYMKNSDIVDHKAGFVLCAPDEGATHFVRDIHEALGPIDLPYVVLKKTRNGERQVQIEADPKSPFGIDAIVGKDVVVIDDMVRTGNTIVEACRLLKQRGAERVVFVVTHFYSSSEVRENLADESIDEIVTTNTMPSILNRDMQGRLRRKMLVLKIEKWIARFLLEHLGAGPGELTPDLYSIDISSKNPRWRAAMQLRS
jgi:ribose-phosphate pyrophosphokinase